MENDLSANGMRHQHRTGLCADARIDIPWIRVAGSDNDADSFSNNGHRQQPGSIDLTWEDVMDNAVLFDADGENLLEETTSSSAAVRQTATSEYLL